MRYRRIAYRSRAIATPFFSAGFDALWTAVLPRARSAFRPPTDVFDTGDALRVKVEVAGLSEEDFEVTVYDDALVIEGERRWEPPPAGARCEAVQIGYGRFRVEVPLACSVDLSRAAARYDRGFLSVELPKSEARP